jgi:CheY-like chemotaxis protein
MGGREAASGEEAIPLCRKLEPDIVTMDIVMPGMGGIEATRRIKEGSPRIKILPITALGTQTRIMDDVIAAGGEETYITKPFDEDQVREILKEIATTHRLAEFDRQGRI